jgi:type II secretory pathway pseudopilin PulG
MYILAKKPRSKASAGFTIIETLIVLIIAGLILLIVFEAIPAVERSSRNNQRKQDVQAMLEAISNYELNNSGDFPPDCGYSGHPSCVGTGNLLQYASLTYYNPATDPATKIELYNQQNSNSGGAGYATSMPGGLKALVGSKADDQVNIYNYEKCDPNNYGGDTVVGAGYNDVVALYAVETGSTSIESECQQL